jgi:N6-adenosine-specific RNA methylase IME4
LLDTFNARPERSRRIKKRDASKEVYCRIPPFPLPESWAHPIQPFNCDKATDLNLAFHCIETDILSTKSSAYPHQEYMSVLIDAPFDLRDSIVSPQPGTINITEFKSLPVGDLVKNGMLFIWTPSELLYEIMTIAESWNFHFVEHATWVMKNITNHFTLKKSEYFNISKCNLLLFRKVDAKGKYSRLELRHQRTPDVHFDFIRYHSQFPKQELKPQDYAYTLIETLLPNATRHLNDDKTSTMLYLWAPKGEKRRGWTMICDTKHMEFLKHNQ